LAGPALCSNAHAAREPRHPTARPAQAQQADVTRLEVGVPIRRKLEPNAAHLYQVSLSAGQYLRVVVLQQGIDVVATLLGPKGQPLIQSDSPNGPTGPEPLSLVAEESGAYRIAVRPSDEKAPAGDYEIRLEALRAAEPRDKDQAAAEKIFRDANDLSSQPSKDAQQQALAKFEQAISLFQALDDRSFLGYSFQVAGFIHHTSGNPQKALQYYSQALGLLQGRGERTNEALMLNNIGGVYEILGEPRKALNHYSRALALWSSLGDRGEQANTLNNIGIIHYQQGELQHALDYYEQALKIQREVDDSRRAADTISNMATVYNKLGESQRALESLKQALALKRAVKDVRGEGLVLYNMAFTYMTLADWARALDYYNQALPLHRLVGNRQDEALTLDLMGVTLNAWGRREKALEYQQQALGVLRTIKNPRLEAITLGDMGDTHSALNHVRKARECYDEALSLAQSIGDQRTEARLLQSVARVDRDGGDLPAARGHIEQAVAKIEAVRTAVDTHWRASYLATNQDAYQFYIDLLMRLHQREPSKGYAGVALQISERARARSLLEQLKEAQVNFREGVDRALIERESDLRQQLNARSERLLRLFGQPQAQEQADKFKSEIAALESEYEQVQAAIRKSSPRYAAVTQPEPLGLQAIQQQLDGETLLLEYALGDERSFVWAVTATSLTAHALPRREAINDQARRVYDLLIARNTLKRGGTPRERRQRVARADAELAAAARQLSLTVLGPVASELSNKRLVIVADGALQYIPFAMLPAPPASDVRATRELAGPPLIVEHEIISLPSASTLAIQRQELAGRKAAPYGIAVIADPVFSASDERLAPHPHSAANALVAGGARILEHLAAAKQGKAMGGGLRIPRLPFTRQEAERIIAAAPAMANFKAVDFNASRATVIGEDLSRYRFIHFATHGYLDTEQPESSALVLSLVNERGAPQDGFLRLREVYNLKLPAELVVLSACQTGLGKEIRGEGLEGLTRGFMYAGAARVVVSLWSVNDRATSELMAKFYQKMLREGQRPAAALRAAQVEMSKQKPWQSPFYWAAFVIQGEWR
jgi:CHAT domain-containing protein/Tfp pilus assembly protein PilF